MILLNCIINVPRNFKAILIFLFFLLCNSLFSEKLEVCFALILLFFIIVVCKKRITNIVFYNITELNTIFIFVLVMSCPYIGHYSLQDVIRDIYIFIVPIVSILLGQLFYKYMRNITEVLKIVTFCGIISSYIYFLKYILYFGFKLAYIFAIRDQIGSISYVSMIALVLIIVNFKYKLFTFRFKKIMVINVIILFLNLIICFSRSSILFVFILIFFLFDLHKLKKSIKMIMTIIALLSILNIYTFKHPDSNMGIFMGKLYNSIDEILIKDYSSEKEINDNWRGYEGYRAINKFNDGSILEKIFGFGAGSRIDLGLSMKLGENVYTDIPYTHNGYTTILIKTGVFGIVLYIIYFLRISLFGYRLSRAKLSNEVQISSRLLLGLCINILVSTYFLGGVYSGTGYFPINLLIGLLLYYCKTCNKGDLE